MCRSCTSQTANICQIQSRFWFMEQFLPATWRAYILHHYKTCLFLWKLFSRRMTDCLSAGIDNTLPKLASGASFLSSIWPDAIQQYFNDLSMDCTGPSAHQCTCSIFKHQYAKGLTILAILHRRQFWFTFICSSQITFSNMSCINVPRSRGYVWLQAPPA